MRDYVGLRKQIEALEGELKPIRDALTASVMGMGGKVEVDDFKLHACEITRESFRLTEALKVLDRRSLSPFITSSTYPQLTVRRKL